MDYKILFSFLKQYKINFILLVSTVTVGFFLIVFLLNMSKYKDYYFEYKYGSVPEWIIMDTQHSSKEFQNIVNKHIDTKLVSFGKYMAFEELAFHLSGERLSYIIKDVYIFGFNYSQDLSIGVSCDGQLKSVNIKKIYSTHSEKWKIKTDTLKDFRCEDKDVIAYFGDHKSKLKLKKNRKRFALFEFDPELHDSNKFYSMLIAMTKHYTKIFHPGRKNSISLNTEDKNIMVSRYKKSLENYFSIIFSSSLPKSISSSHLANQISNFKHVSQEYTITHKNSNSNIVIKDIINFPIDENSKFKYLSNSLFLKQSVLPEFNSVKEKGNFAFIYTKKLDNFDDSIIYISKKDLLPKYKEQKELIDNLIHTSVAMIAIFIFIIIAIALVRFYLLYKRDLFLLKIYSYSRLIYAELSLLIVFCASIVSYFFLTYSFKNINTILVKYYQPILHFETIDLAFVVLYSIFALGILILVEYKIWKKLIVSIK
jgi:hypothetical protein